MRKPSAPARQARRLQTASSAPLYKQITSDIERRIARGEWADGSRLPSENELVRRLGVSRMTVNRALRDLTERGLVSRVKGLGTFVAAAGPQFELVAIRDIAEEIKERGHRHSAKVYALEAVRADAEQAGAFDAKLGAKLFRSLIVHYEDSTPIQLEERYISPVFAPEFLKQDFEHTTPTAYLQGLGAATEIEQIVYAATTSVTGCKLLKMERSTPCIILVRRTWIEGVPVTKSTFTSPGDRYSLGSRYVPSQLEKR